VKKRNGRALLVLSLTFAFLLILPTKLFVPSLKRRIYNGAATENTAPFSSVVTIEDGDYVLFGRYLGEPILWRVIPADGENPLLFSEYVLCFKAFTACANPFEGSSDWQGSTLRQWLNSAREAVPYASDPPLSANLYEGRNGYADEPGFLSAGNFSDAETALIETGADGDNGGDAVFLLTKKQLQKLPAEQRKKSPTKATLRQDDSPYLFLRPTCWYWTADPIDTNTKSVCAVTGKGTFYKSLSTDGMNGVCPALRLNSPAIEVTGGDGSKENPYKIAEGAGT